MDPPSEEALDLGENKAKLNTSAQSQEEQPRSQIPDKSESFSERHRMSVGGSVLSRPAHL